MKKYSIGFIVIEIAVLLVISIIPTAFVEHVELCKVYSIAGIDPAVINHIDSPAGTRLIRKSSEEFDEDRNQPAFMEKWR